jgi:hypothetical protein
MTLVYVPLFLLVLTTQLSVIASPHYLTISMADSVLCLGGRYSLGR